MDGQNKLSYYLYNAHGDVVQTVAENGIVENQYDYDIFGTPTLTIEIYSNAIRYAGEFYDAENGLYYLRARYYNPSIGRFISEDSYWGEDSNPLSLNLYTYTTNNPIKFIDPSGHFNAEVDGHGNTSRLDTNMGSSFKYDLGYGKRSTVRLNSNNGDVKALQEMLISIGYDLGESGADGKFGKMTERAVRAFQQANKLEADGVVGDKTWNALKGSYKGGHQVVSEPVRSTKSNKSNKTSAGRNENKASNNPTMADIVQANPNSPLYKNTAYEAQKYFLAWYYGSSAYDRYYDYTMKNSSFIIAILISKQKSGEDISLLTVSKMDELYNSVLSVSFKVESAAQLGSIAYASYKMGKAQAATRYTSGAAPTVTQKGPSNNNMKNAPKGAAKAENVLKECPIAPVGEYSTVTISKTQRSLSPWGKANSTVDLLYENGIVKQRRVYGPDGKGLYDIDFTNHGNPKIHPDLHRNDLIWDGDIFKGHADPTTPWINK